MLRSGLPGIVFVLNVEIVLNMKRLHDFTESTNAGERPKRVCGRRNGFALFDWIRINKPMSNKPMRLHCASVAVE